VGVVPFASNRFCFLLTTMADSFAYVDFATPEAKNAAILMTESPLEGRRLLIKDGACICILFRALYTFF
jgi:RNA recognition motif-containing protein